MTAARRVLAEVFGFEAFRPGQTTTQSCRLLGGRCEAREVADS